MVYYSPLILSSLFTFALLPRGVFAAEPSCAPGTFSPTGYEPCVSCPAGTFSDSSGGQLCTACPADTFSSTGASSCSPCDPGSIAAAGASSCTLCPAGTYADQGTCVACTGSTYSAAGAASCTQCPSTKTVNADHTGCVGICPAGYYYLEGFGACLACAAGTYAADGDDVCTTCPAGTFSPVRSSSCCECCSGFYSTAAGSTSCTQCPGASPFSASGSTSSSQCASGTGYALTCAASGDTCPATVPAPLPSGGVSVTRRNGPAANTCKKGWRSCPVYGTLAHEGFLKGYECVDVKNDLESCGGCVADDSPFGERNEDGGRDCSAIPNADAVSCRRGRCVIEDCATGYVLSANGEDCISLADLLPWWMNGI